MSTKLDDFKLDDLKQNVKEKILLVTWYAWQAGYYLSVSINLYYSWYNTFSNALYTIYE